MNEELAGELTRQQQDENREAFEWSLDRLSELAAWQSFHSTCAFGRCKRAGQCQWRQGKPLRQMTAEDIEFHKAGAPFCVVTMGGEERERVHQLAWGGYYDDLYTDKKRAEKERRKVRLKKARRRRGLRMTGKA